MIRLIIAGSRDFQNYELLEKEFCKFMEGQDTDNITIISGTARGADRLGEQIAFEYQINLEQYPAKWDEYGKSAGYKRNTQMALTATHALIAWNGTSKGTQHMINLAYQHGLTTKVVKYETI